MTRLKKVEDQINSTIEGFLSNLQNIDVSRLSESELVELQSVISDFKSDIGSLSTLETLSSTLKEALDSKLVSELTSEIQTNTTLTEQQSNEKKVTKNTSIGYGKLQPD